MLDAEYELFRIKKTHLGIEDDEDAVSTLGYAQVPETGKEKFFKLRNEWKEKHLKTLRDVLEYYAALDVCTDWSFKLTNSSGSCVFN